MTSPAQCRILGRWRIVASDIWDEDYLHLVGSASVVLGATGHGELVVREER